jgi:hypothetical protein
MSVVAVLAVIALLLAVVSLFKPEFPLLGVAVILVCAALLVPAFVR